ncbi:unnamed protein product, partial [Scytosiphon promiscuus]
MASNPTPRDANQFQSQPGGAHSNDTHGAPTRKRGDRVIVCGQNAEGKTYRTATVSMTSVNEEAEAWRGEGGVTETAIKVHFTGTAKGAPDEHVHPTDLLDVNHETMRLKKECDVRAKRKSKGKPTGRGRGRPPGSSKKNATKPTTPGPAGAAAAAAAAATTMATSGTTSRFSSPPSHFSMQQSQTPSEVVENGGKRKAGEMGLPSPSPFSSPPPFLSSPSLPSGGGPVRPEDSAGGFGAGLTTRWTAATEESAPAPGGSSSDAGGRGGGGYEGDSAQEFSWRDVALGSGGDGHGGDGLYDHEKERPPPSFPDMIVEALHALSNSRGSSQLATVNWLKASRYGWIAAQDEFNFKARVAAGIKQALDEAKIVRVRTNYRISPEHAKALDLPTSKRRKKNASTANGGDPRHAAILDARASSESVGFRDRGDGESAVHQPPAAVTAAVQLPSPRAAAVAAVPAAGAVGVDNFASGGGGSSYSAAPPDGGSGETNASKAWTGSPTGLSGWLQPPGASRDALVGHDQSAARIGDTGAAAGAGSASGSARVREGQKEKAAKPKPGRPKGRPAKTVGWEASAGGSGRNGDGDGGSGG